MIDGRETHLDSLEYRLQEPRVKRIVQAVITGDTSELLTPRDNDVALTLDLGLIRIDENKKIVIANPVYEELLSRFLAERYYYGSPAPSSWRWQKEDGTLDMDAMLREFQKFWRRNSEIWESKADYTEAFPHLLLMGFLQRITNGTGTVERESAAGSGRMDIKIEYKGTIIILEIKLIQEHDGKETVEEEGLEQIARYRNSIDSSAPAYLIIFDRRASAKKKTWDERLTWTAGKDASGGALTIVGC
jgi:hypothetical protein